MVQIIKVSISTAKSSLFPDYKGCSPWCRQHLTASHYQTYAGYSLGCWQRWFNEFVDLSLHYPNPPGGGRKPKAIWTSGHWSWHDINAGQFYGAPPEEPWIRWCRNDLCKSSGCGGGRGRWWSWNPRAPFIPAQHGANPCLRWWHLAPSATKLLWTGLSSPALSLLPVQSLELCHVGRRSPLHCENRFHISRSQNFPCHREEH